ASAGLAPREFRCGSSVRRRTRLSKAGNARLRQALYLLTLAAVRFNPLLQGPSSCGVGVTLEPGRGRPAPPASTIPKHAPAVNRTRKSQRTRKFPALSNGVPSLSPLRTGLRGAPAAQRSVRCRVRLTLIPCLGV